MRVDIRTPIGALFVVIGVMLVVYGMLADHAIYTKSLGLNVNLWWGLVLLAFGAVFVFFGARREPTSATDVDRDAR
ncbi:MAG TPA: hypothetical protein VJ867_09190 [Gemmatimonadaceae bacterium]|nr:hypothetical protein [Gemmatimonadaceae bacterium]